MALARAWPALLLGLWVLVGCISIFLPEASVELGRALETPSMRSPLGTDALGRPLTALLAGGAWTALLIGATSVLLAGTAGVIVGTAAGYAGGWIDTIAMRVVDVLLAFPGILLAIAITAVLGPKTEHLILALTLLGWTGFARLARGQTLQLRSQSFVHAGRVIGISPWRQVVRHLIPNLIGPVFVQASFGMAGAILAESSLAFLGLGDPTRPSWGGLLSEGVRHLRSAPHLSMLPGLCIFVVVLALNVAGDELRDYFDPQNR